MKTIGSKIKELRLQLKLSQEELAKKVGYSDRTSISKIESDKIDLTQSKVLEFADALGTTPAYLMGWEPPKVIAAHSDKNLTPEQQEKVLEYIRFLQMEEKDKHDA